MKSTTTLLALTLAAASSAVAESLTTSLPALYPTGKPTDTVITFTTDGQTYTIPVWNPTTELTYGAPGTTLATDGPEQPPSPTSTPTPSTRPSASPSASASASASPSKSSSASKAPDSSAPASQSTRTGSPTASAPPQQSSNAAAAVGVRGGTMGAVVGGLALAWAM